MAGCLATWALGCCFVEAAEFRSDFLSLGLSDKAPAFSVFSVDSLGQGRLTTNPVLKEDKAISGLQLDGQTFKLGRKEDAQRILHPMLDGFAKGKFQGFDDYGMSRDWRDWKGGGHALFPSVQIHPWIG